MGIEGIAFHPGPFRMARSAESVPQGDALQEANAILAQDAAEIKAAQYPSSTTIPLQLGDRTAELEVLDPEHIELRLPELGTVKFEVQPGGRLHASGDADPLVRERIERFLKENPAIEMAIAGAAVAYRYNHGGIPIPLGLASATIGKGGIKVGYAGKVGETEVRAELGKGRLQFGAEGKF